MIVNAVANGVALLAGSWVLVGSLWWTACRVLDQINAACRNVQWARTEPDSSRRTRR
jgi:hypothetical protein